MQVKKRSAGIVVVRSNDEEWLFLLLRAYRNWDFPKGVIEAGEDPLVAAMRETLEETSIDDLAFPWGTEFIETEPYAGGKVARYYVAQAKRAELVLPVSPILRRAEHHEYRWLAFEQASLLLVPRLKQVIEWAWERINSTPRDLR